MPLAPKPLLDCNDKQIIVFTGVTTLKLYGLESRTLLVWRISCLQAPVELSLTLTFTREKVSWSLTIAQTLDWGHT